MGEGDGTREERAAVTVNSRKQEAPTGRFRMKVSWTSSLAVAAIGRIHMLRDGSRNA